MGIQPYSVEPELRAGMRSRVVAAAVEAAMHIVITASVRQTQEVSVS